MVYLIEPSESPLLKEMTIYLLKELPSHCRSKYGMLSCIVEKIGTKTILEWHSLLPIDLFEALEDCSLVSHVSNYSYSPIMNNNFFFIVYSFLIHFLM